MKPSRESFFSRRANKARKHEEQTKTAKKYYHQRDPRPVVNEDDEEYGLGVNQNHYSKIGVVATQRVIWD